MNDLAAAHLVAAAAYAGFQWTVNVLVYRQFPLATHDFPAYERGHQRRVSLLVGPLFVALVTTTGLTLRERPDDVAAWVSVGALATILLVTAVRAAPLHGRLGRGWDPDLHAALLRADGVRVAAATIGVAAAVVLAR